MSSKLGVNNWVLKVRKKYDLGRKIVSLPDDSKEFKVAHALSASSQEPWLPIIKSFYLRLPLLGSLFLL